MNGTSQVIFIQKAEGCSRMKYRRGGGDTKPQAYSVNILCRGGVFVLTF